MKVTTNVRKRMEANMRAMPSAKKKNNRMKIEVRVKLKITRREVKLTPGIEESAKPKMDVTLEQKKDKRSIEEESVKPLKSHDKPVGCSLITPTSNPTTDHFISLHSFIHVFWNGQS
jgi:hypothetical protein